MSIIHGSAPLWHKQFSAEYRSVIVQQKQQYQNCQCQCHIKPHYFIQFASYTSLHAVLLTSHLLLLTFLFDFPQLGLGGSMFVHPVWQYQRGLLHFHGIPQLSGVQISWRWYIWGRGGVGGMGVIMTKNSNPAYTWNQHALSHGAADSSIFLKLLTVQGGSHEENLTGT